MHRPSPAGLQIHMTVTATMSRFVTIHAATAKPFHLLSLLDSCGSADHLRQIHAHIITTGSISNGFLANRLLALLAASDPDYASSVLTHAVNPNAFSWNLVIRGYADSDRPREAVVSYIRMMRTGLRPDNLTMPFVLKACGKAACARVGHGVFGHAVEMGLDSDLYVRNATVHSFGALGEIRDARKVFDESPERDLVSWNSMINAYTRRGYTREVLELFREMRRGNVVPDEVTMIGVVSCCAQLGDLDLGNELRRYIKENGVSFTIRLANALMDMYVKCGCLEEAEWLFAKMERKTVVSWTTMLIGHLKFGLVDSAKRLFYEMPKEGIVPWNAMIAGLVRCKREIEAVALFHEMQRLQVKPDEVTMVSLLSACSRVGALDVGIWLHHYIDRNLPINVPLGTALLDMYAKCGNIKKSAAVFSKMRERNALTWTAMICGLASHGLGHEAIRYFLQMLEIGLQPDEVTFVGVLSACCHAGLVDRGRKYFSEMQSIYGIKPKPKHYSCMVDLLGRAGFVDKAEELVRSMPMKPDAAVLGALFFACRVHAKVSMGEHAALQLLELDPLDSGIYVLLANMYAEEGMRDKARQARLTMRERRVEKTPGGSSVEVNGVVYEFLARDNLHPQTEEIRTCLIQLAQQMELEQHLEYIDDDSCD